MNNIVYIKMNNGDEVVGSIDKEFDFTDEELDVIFLKIPVMITSVRIGSDQVAYGMKPWLSQDDFRKSIGVNINNIAAITECPKKTAEQYVEASKKLIEMMKENDSEYELNSSDEELDRRYAENFDSDMGDNILTFRPKNTLH